MERDTGICLSLCMCMCVYLSLSISASQSQDRKGMSIFATAQGELYWKVVRGWPPRIPSLALSMASWVTLGRFSPRTLDFLIFYFTTRGCLPCCKMPPEWACSFLPGLGPSKDNPPVGGFQAALRDPPTPQ